MAQERSSLLVEGRDDKFVIENLLKRHGIDRSVVDITSSDEGIRQVGGKDVLLAGVTRAVRASEGSSVGFVLDADGAVQNRWDAVRGRLREVGLNPPDEIPEDGYVDDAVSHGARVGVWLMPDNRRAGAVEDFLMDLVGGDGDALLRHAEASTTTAREEHGASFPPADRDKAVLHAWLAWQQSPGLPYGTAIAARFFRHDGPAALAFLAWFRRVFGA